MKEFCWQDLALLPKMCCLAMFSCGSRMAAATSTVGSGCCPRAHLAAWNGQGNPSQHGEKPPRRPDCNFLCIVFSVWVMLWQVNLQWLSMVAKATINNVLNHDTFDFMVLLCRCSACCEESSWKRPATKHQPKNHF